jgi:hypothetical protein
MQLQTTFKSLSDQQEELANVMQKFVSTLNTWRGSVDRRLNSGRCDGYDMRESSIIPYPPATPAKGVGTDHTSQTTKYSKKETGFKSYHTAPAHFLMEKWNSMAFFSKGVCPLKNLDRISDYVFSLEQNRGVIRVWGAGEDTYLNDGATNATFEELDLNLQNPHVTPAPLPRIRAEPHLVKEKLWGSLDASSPMNIFTSQDSNSQENPGGLDSDGRLKIDSATVDSLYKSYIKNIHNLHPFLNPSELKHMMQSFADKYDSTRSRIMHAGTKRERSRSNDLDSFSPGIGATNKVIEKSLSDAIVLLVLALGKVASYTNKLPSPEPNRRNIDILPGMAYFGYATDILGNHIAGNTVAHAHANILAALYVAQYARVLESWSWINCACRICLVLIKS